MKTKAKRTKKKVERTFAACVRSSNKDAAKASDSYCMEIRDQVPQSQLQTSDCQNQNQH